MNTPGDVIRVIPLDSPELPDRVREIPTDGTFDPIADGVLMLHQKIWIKQLHEFDLNIAEKGRRTGITYATALDDSITAASNRAAGGDNSYYVGDTKEKGLEFIGYCAKMAKIMACAMASGCHDGIEVFLFEDQQDDGSSKQITSYRIRFASGFQIVALSSNPANIRGLQGIVNIDEAAFHKNVKAVIDACLALLIWGGKIRIISTHNTVKNPFNHLIRDALAGLNAFKVFHCTFDDAVNNGLYERVCLIKGWTPTPEGKQTWYDKIRKGYGTNIAAMKEELDAIPREGTGVAIHGVWIDRAMRERRPVVRLTLDDDFAYKTEKERESWCEAWIKKNLEPLLPLLCPSLEHVFGMDFARHRHFSEICPLEIEQDLTRKAPFVIELHNVPTRQQEQVLWYMIDHLPNFRGGAMDATGPGQTLAEYTADRYRKGVDQDGKPIEMIHQINLNRQWYTAWMSKMVRGFEDGIYDLPRDVNLENDLRAVEEVDGVPMVPKIEIKDVNDPSLKLVRHGDFAISLAMGEYAALNKVKPAPIEFKAGGAAEIRLGSGSHMNNYMRT